MKKIFIFLAAFFLCSLLSAQKIAHIYDDATADGDFSKWNNIPVIRYGSLTHTGTPREWKGVADASASIRLGWKNDFLCIAGIVYDDIDTPDDRIEIGLSGKQNTGLFARDILRINIIPSDNKREIRQIKYANLPKGTFGMERVEEKFTKIKGGYSFELFIPFELIPDLKSPDKGGGVSFQLRMIDGDSKRVYPQMIDKTNSMPYFQFAERPLDKPDRKDAEFYTNLSFDKTMTSYEPKFRIEVADTYLKKSGELTVSIGDVKKTFKKSDLKLDDGFLYAESTLDLKKLKDGQNKIILSVKQSDKNPEVFTFNTDIYLLADATTTLLGNTLAHLEKVDLSGLAVRDPFKASAYFSVVSALEWLKWGIIQKQSHAIIEASNEIRARLDAIEGRPLPAQGKSVYSLLELTRNPDAQLVVEYFRERTPLYPYLGSISVHFGNLDIVSCMFFEYKTPAEALKSLDTVKKDKHVVKRSIGSVEIWDVPQTIKEPSGEVLVSPITGTFFFVLNNIRFEIPYVSRPSAEKFASAIISNKPFTLEQRESIVADIVKATGRTPRKLKMPEGLELFCGDNHSHTFLSDGRPTPLTVTAEALYIGLDYHIISDHGVYRGALRYVDNVLKKNGLDYPVGVGVELNSKWGHMNVYPVPWEGGYSFGPEYTDMIDAAHSIEGAIIQWNHPDTDYSNLPKYLENGLAGSGIDAWEHYPPHYSKWKREGKLPVITGGTDTHNGTFHMPERSVMFIPDSSCASIAKGVKENKMVMLDTWNGAYTITRGMPNKSRWDSDLFFYGSDEMIQLAVDCLADKNYLIDLKRKRIGQYLKEVKVKELVNASDAYETVK